MAIRFIKSGSIAHDIEEVFKDANGVVNPGISGEVYRKLEDLGDAGQKRMYLTNKRKKNVVPLQRNSKPQG